jgi:hypothetical protein
MIARATNELLLSVYTSQADAFEMVVEGPEDPVKAEMA